MNDTFEYHKTMLSDRYRTNAFKKAILQAVKPGDVVLDLGAGTGILSFFALKAGAKRVYAVEIDSIIEIAKELAKENELNDKIIFFNSLSTDISLPERVDVIISETLGSFGLEEDIVGFMSDARKRFLKKGGLLIPLSIDIFLVPVDAKDIYREINFWKGNHYGIKLDPLREMAVNNQYNRYIERDNYLSKPKLLKHFDLRKTAKSSLDETAEYVISRKGTFHGLAGWFKARLSERIVLSTASPRRTPSWSIAFFPVEKPLNVSKGDRILSRISLSKWRGETIWNWDVEVKLKSGKKARFSHSTFRGFPVNKKDFKKLSPEHRPSLETSTRINQFILNQCNGKRSALQIAKNLMEKYPDVYNSLEKALQRTISLISQN